MLRRGLPALLVVLVALRFAPLYADSTWVLPVAASAGIPLVLASRRVRDKDPFLVVAAVLAAWIVVLHLAVLPALLPGLPSGEGLGRLGDSLLNGWARLLTSAPPVRSEPSTVVPVSALCWGASLLSAWLADRALRVAWLLPPLACYATAVALVPDVVGAAAFATSTMLVVGLVLLRTSGSGGAAATPTAHGRRLSRKNTPRMVPGAVAGVLVVAFALPLGSALAADREAYDPRRLVDPPIATPALVSPLSELAGDLGDDSEVFAVVSDGVIDYLPRVALDRFNGTVWAPGNEYVRVEGALPEGDRRGEPSAAVAQDFSQVRLPQRWLPAVHGAVRISMPAGYDPMTGTLLALRPASAYQVTSQPPPEPPLDELDEAEPVPPVGGRVASPPAAIAAEAARVVAPGRSPYRRLLLLEAYFAESGAFSASTEPTSGHSFGHICALLFPGAPRASPDAGPCEVSSTTSINGQRLGSSEQFASAFASMASSLGFESRVVVGYRMRQAIVVGDRTAYTVQANYGHAWPEINLQGVGWVRFEPTPQGVGASSPEETQTEVVGGAGGPDAAPEQADATQSGSEEGPSEPMRSTARRAAAVVAGLLGTAALVGGVIVLLKRRRANRRRSTGSPRDRLLAAWAEVLDRLRELGVVVPASHTPTEVTERARALMDGLGRTALLMLAAGVDRALFGPEEPSEHEVAEAWTQARRAGDGIARSVSWPRRLGAKLDPRPLLP